MTKEKSDVKNNVNTLLKGREMVYNGFESGVKYSFNSPISSIT